MLAGPRTSCSESDTIALYRTFLCRRIFLLQPDSAVHASLPQLFNAPFCLSSSVPWQLPLGSPNLAQPSRRRPDPALLFISLTGRPLRETRHDLLRGVLEAGGGRDGEPALTHDPPRLVHVRACEKIELCVTL